MERPKKEFFEGVNLMNGPYDLSRYSEHLNKYIDHLENERKGLVTKIKAETEHLNQEERNEYFDLMLTKTK